MKPQGQDNISVYLRIRPFNEKQQNTENIVQRSDGKSIRVKDKQSQHQFTFDGIFNQKSTQEQVYEKVGKDVVQFAFQGFNGTIFAYGQTSSGKTHTCIGPDYHDDMKMGILPRLVSQIFDKIAEEPPYIEFRIKISMVQIYLEKIKDLFDTSKTDVKIRQNKSKGVYLQDITEEYVASTTQAIKFFQRGIANRTVAQTNMNDVSSRSHMAFVVTLYQNNLKDASAKSGKIILIDLAGSQKVSKTMAQGKVLDQAKNINKSLSALGNVINALTDPKTAHIPYRDSKLTRLLQQSLGGNSKTRLIINVSPSLYNFSESLSSLRFGFRAKQIKNKPRVNRQYTVAQLLMLLEKAEKRIQQLQKGICELSSVKKKMSKSKGPSFIQNLLDSDNPILSGLSQTQGQSQPRGISKQLSGIKQNRFESEAASDDQNQFRTPSKLQISSSKNKQQKLNQERIIERNQLLQVIRDLTLDKNEEYRQIQILQEKYEIAAKQARLLSSKYNSMQKQNQKLLQKVVTSKLENQEKQSRLKDLQRQVQSYQESIKQMMRSKQSKVSKVFGTPQKQGKQSNKLIQKYQLFQEMQKQRLNPVDYATFSTGQQKQSECSQVLRKRILDLQGQISMYRNLQENKQALIKQKLQFVSQKQRVYKDLQNRIQKVLYLQQQLDQLKQKNRFLEQIVNTEESEKGRKILNLQKHLDDLSENYYVLKGQQSSWINNNRRYEQKIQRKEHKIKELEKETIELKGEIEGLKMNQNDTDQDQLGSLDFEGLDQNPFARKQGKIVKIIRSHIHL